MGVALKFCGTAFIFSKGNISESLSFEMNTLATFKFLVVQERLVIHMMKTKSTS